MAEGGGPGLGRGGRGAAITKLLHMEKKPGQQANATTVGDQPAGVVHTPVPTTQAPIPSVGRGMMLQQLQKPTVAPQPPLTQSAIPPITGGQGAMPYTLHQAPALQPFPERPLQAPVSGGRGKALQMISSSAQPVPAPQVPEPRAHPNVQVEEVRRKMGDMHIAPDKPPVTARGVQGQSVQVTANYIPLYLQPGRGIFEYEVRIYPEEDDKFMREKLIFGQHRELFGRSRRTFDGVTLYLPRKVPDESLNLTSIHPVTNETHNIVMSLRREKAMTECTHMYNVLFKNIQRELNLIQLDRKYYSQEQAHSIPQHKLEVWPGFVTAVDAYEGGIMLNCDVSHKVLRTQTVYDLINEVVHATSGRDWQQMLQKQVIGQVVMTKRPVRTYRVDDIDFTQNPLCTFQDREGKAISFVEYHRRKDIHIKDMKQPLLVHRPKPTQRGTGTDLIMLIPELCFMTGLTDDMRADFKVMKDVAMFTRVNPNQRQLALQKFIDNIKASPNCIKLLDEWGLKVPENTIQLTGRTMDPEPIIFGRNYVEGGSVQADWGRAATNQHMLDVVHIQNWLVVFAQRDERNANGFVEMMNKVCPQMGCRLEYPALEKLRDDRTESYLKAIRASSDQGTQIVVIIFPTARDDRYSAVKKLLCVDKPIPSQVINSRTIGRPEKLRSIVQKIALQMNCKLGGSLWSVKIPMKRMMICGIDTYHDSKVRAQSVAAFVASTNMDLMKWFSQVFIQSSLQEMLDGITQALLQALYKYYSVNNCYPDTVVIYRDGVGDGQLKVCEEHELKALRNAFNSVNKDYNPNLALVICQKRINTRIFLQQRGGYDNPPPGTVVDHNVTRRYYEDFFLISQLVRQGTVSPTHYIVLHNSTVLNPDRLQKLTYKMCHLYYNWPGTVRVPAPCQYAHKLAHLVGCSIHKTPASVLCDKLFFL